MNNNAVPPLSMTFEEIVQMAEAAIHEAMNAPPTELVVLKRQMGGYDMRLRRIGLLDRLLSTS